MSTRQQDFLVVVILVGAALVPARVVWAACYKDCKFTVEACTRTNNNDPFSLGLQYVAAQGGYWYSNASDRALQCELEGSISYTEWSGCSSVQCPNSDGLNSVGTVGGLKLKGNKTQQKYGCKNSGPVCDTI
jgi:hypothetical protein